MNPVQYLESRVDDQISWYSQRSTFCQRRFKIIRITQICCSAIVPLSAGLIHQGIWNQLTTGTLGIIVAIATALDGLFKDQENWIRYRSTSEMLKHEKHLFLTQTDPYMDENSFPSLVTRIERIISSENTTWISTIASTKHKGERKLT